MKRTTVMLAVIATFFLTWVLLAGFGVLVSNETMKNLMSNEGIIVVMFVFGWIPATIVGVDLSERLGL